MMNLVLQPNEVPLAALVFICPPGETIPLVDAPPLKRMLGGVPTRAKWYPSTLEGKITNAGFETVKEGVRFIPVNVYSLADAPLGKELAVYINNEWIPYAKYPDTFVNVTRLKDGTYMSVNGYAYDHWLRRYELPASALLVAHGSCGYHATVDDAVRLPTIYEGSDVSEMLRDAGATYSRGFRQSKDPDFFDVWLPSGWTLRIIVSEDKVRREVLLDQNVEERAYVTWVTMFGRTEGSIVLKQS